MTDKQLDIITTCGRLKLDGAWMIGVYGVERCASAFNGIGSDAMPAAARKVLDTLHGCMLPAAFLHDVSWALDSDGSEDYFHASNDAFLANCLICIDDYYDWYNPIRFWQRHKAKQFHTVLERWGWSAYRAAYTERFAREVEP